MVRQKPARNYTQKQGEIAPKEHTFKEDRHKDPVSSSASRLPITVVTHVGGNGLWLPVAKAPCMLFSFGGYYSLS